MQISCSTVWEFFIINSNTFFCTNNPHKKFWNGVEFNEDKKTKNNHRHIHMPSKRALYIHIFTFSFSNIAIRKQGYWTWWKRKKINVWIVYLYFLFFIYCSSINRNILSWSEVIKVSKATLQLHQLSSLYVFTFKDPSHNCMAQLYTTNILRPFQTNITNSPTFNTSFVLYCQNTTSIAHAHYFILRIKCCLGAG